MNKIAIQMTAVIMNYLHRNAPSEFTSNEIVNFLDSNDCHITFEHVYDETEEFLEYMAQMKFIIKIESENYVAYRALKSK